ncbi:MAG: hypothetical protein KGI56_00235 [Acidobacteriota bacterium]|nr:hypothetical protein [Acidobacteriota bacterium]
MTRLERAQQARLRAQQMEAQARKLEAEEREQARKRDVARKAILGGALLAGIRGGNLTREDWERLILPCIIERDRQRLKGWPWDSNESIHQLDKSES